jgi:hypothetical protein
MASASVNGDHQSQAKAKDGDRDQKMSVSYDGARLFDEGHRFLT